MGKAGRSIWNPEANVMTQITVGGPQHQAAVEAVGPIAQASTNATANVAGAEIDARQWRTVCYNVAAAGNAVDWSVWGANASDYSDEVAVKAATKVNAGANDTYAASPAPYAYYRVKIIDDVGGTHGTATVNGIAKG